MNHLAVKVVALAAIVALGVVGVGASAWAADGAKGAWYQVYYFKFKFGEADDAMKIVSDHFLKVDQTIGRKAIPFTYESGEWDHVVYFPSVVTAGRFDTLPSEEKWFAALAEQEGGPDKAQAILQKFLDLVTNFKKDIARIVPAPWLP